MNLLIHLLCTIRSSDDSTGTSTKIIEGGLPNFIITKTPIVTQIVSSWLLPKSKPRERGTELFHVFKKEGLL